MWLNGIGIRVTDMRRSLRFYADALGLEEVARGGSEEEGQVYVLLRDPASGQKLELNWYSPDKSLFGVPYTLGEALDHLEVRVDSVPDELQRLASLGIMPLNMRPYFEPPYKTAKNGHRTAFVADPDGIQICLYDHPEEGDHPSPGETY